MFNIGPAELIVVFLVALLVVGPRRLPQLGRTIGKSLREFRRATDDFKQSFEFGIDDDDFPDEEPNGHKELPAASTLGSGEDEPGEGETDRP
jgi:sec-independent protein translocase protein TatA